MFFAGLSAQRGGKINYIFSGIGTLFEPARTTALPVLVLFPGVVRRLDGNPDGGLRECQFFQLVDSSGDVLLEVLVVAEEIVVTT